MNWQQIRERIKISFKLFGFGGEYEIPESEFTVANRVIKKLEDRQVLIDPPFREDVSSCVKSVQEIRGLLTEELANVLVGSKLEPIFQAMASACRRFLSELKKHNIPTSSTVDSLAPDQTSHFHIALGKLREAFGVHIGLIAVLYKLNVHDDLDDDLASIVPEEE